MEKENFKKYTIYSLILILLITRLIFLENFLYTAQQTITVTYAAIALDTCFFGLFYIYFKKREIAFPFLLGFCVSNIILYMACVANNLQDISNVLSAILIEPILPFKFVSIAVKEESLVWFIALSFYLGVFLIIWGKFFVKDKSNFKTKNERKIAYMGFGLYLALFPFAFFVTHFSSAGAYFQYGDTIMQYTDAIVKKYDEKNQKDYFRLKNLKYFSTFEDVEKYYISPSYKEMIDSESNKGKEYFYKETVRELNNFKKYGWYNTSNMKYEQVSNFREWVHFAYNFKLRGVDNSKTMWVTDFLPIPKESKQIRQDVSRHAIFYMHEAKNGGFYTLVSFDRSFRDNNITFMFNYIFMAYHFIFIIALILLIRMHNRKFSKGLTPNV